MRKDKGVDGRTTIKVEVVGRATIIGGQEKEDSEGRDMLGDDDVMMQ